MGRDASRIAEEVIQNLTGIVGAEVEITCRTFAELTEGRPNPAMYARIFQKSHWLLGSPTGVAGQLIRSRQSPETGRDERNRAGGEG